MSVQTDYAAIVPQWEGRASWLYRDSEGLATTAEGKELADVNASLALPWLTITGLEATADEITEDWNRVMAMPADLKSTAYQDHQQGLHLADATIDGITLDSVDDAYDQLLVRWTGLASFPEPGQLGLLDMGYNLGVPRFLRQYPRLCAAVDEGHWLLAAAESPRDASIASFEPRNTWTAQQFALAALAPTQ